MLNKKILMNNKLQAFYKNKKILITGGAGFIGSHLVDALVALDANVTVLDNLSTGNLANLEHSIDKINFIHGDITKHQTCAAAVSDKEIVFHLAAFVSVPASMQDPLACHNINVNGTLNLLHASHGAIKRFIFSSSSAVYGNTQEICSETMLCNPASPYALSKLIGEHYCKLYAEQFNVPSICLRYFNVFGARQSPHGAYAGVVAKFMHAMHHNEPIIIFGDGSQRRDFIQVEDVVNANLLLGMLPQHFLTGQPINIASGNSITLLELIEGLKKQFPTYQQQPQFKAARLGDIHSSQADCSILHSLINHV